jgi:hypothetical protein
VKVGDEQLIELWHSREPASQIARELGIELYELQQAWAALKGRGLIPDQARQRTAINPVVAAQRYDEIPIALNDDDVDPLLKRLIEVHGPRS